MKINISRLIQKYLFWAQIENRDLFYEINENLIMFFQKFCYQDYHHNLLDTQIFFQRTHLQIPVLLAGRNVIVLLSFLSKLIKQ